MWLVGLMSAFFGIYWAMLGVTLLASYPGSVIAVGLAWAGYAAFLALAGALNRRLYHRRYGW